MKKLIPSFVLVIVFAGWQSCNNNQPSDNLSQQKFIETGYIDSAIKPGDSFFLYANGKWLDTAVVPKTENQTGSVLEIYKRTREHLKNILDSTSSTSNPSGSIEQQVGDLYASGIDTATIEKRGYDPVKPFLLQIDSIKNGRDIIHFVAAQQKMNNAVLYSQSVYSDQKKSSVNILNFFQGGLGLPDRDYYFKKDPATEKIVQAYQAYIKKLFMLTGSDSAGAAKKTAAIYAFEKQMAGSHKTNVELRDPESNYHKIAVTTLDKQMPVLGWRSLLNDLGIHTDTVIVGQPAFFIKVNELLKSAPLATWKDYLKFNVLNNASTNLSSDFEKAEFEYSKTLSGQQQIKPRWERIMQVVDGSIGDALGQIYVKKYFTEDAKKRIYDLVNNLQKAFEERINNLDWMSADTKSKAKDKLHAFLKKVGYTDKWRDYSKVKISRDTYFENLLSSSENEYQYQISKVDKPVDKTEWGLTASTIDAYYNPTFNEIVFPAGILQYPFFNPDADDAVNYGGIGAVIGHEMTHGFDDQGAQYDKDGNLKNWWGKDDSVKFAEKTKLVIDQYDGFVVIDSMHINGKLTTGENIGDMGGVAIAYTAFKMTKEGQDSTKIDGFTPDQRFFLSYAQIWRVKRTDELTRRLINTDPHSPPMFRVLGPLMNFTPFYTAFDVKEGEKMYKPEKDRIKIW